MQEETKVMETDPMEKTSDSSHHPESEVILVEKSVSETYSKEQTETEDV